MQPPHAEPNDGAAPQRARWVYPSDGIPAAQQHAAWHSGSERTLRTQLAVVKGFSQLLERSLQHADAPARAAALSTQLVTHVADLEQLLLRYLAASRLQGGGADLAWNALDLSALTRQVTHGFDDGPGATPALQLVPAEPVQGVWDARWLQEALRALISNALRYSPPDGSVQIALRREDAHVRVAVSDSGPGVAPNERERIFLPFVRGSAARAVPGGCGLGLFIAGRVAEIHGGTIEVESAPGAGSVFTLCLPLFPPSDPPDPSQMH